MRVNCRPLLLLGALGLAQASAQGLLVLREEDAQPQQSTGLMAYLQEQYERSSAMLQSLMESTLRDSNPSGGVQIVILEEEDESDDTLDATDRRLACETALRQLHEQDAAKQDHKSRLHSSLRHALHFMTSFRSIDQASCDDLDRDVLREECTRVLANEKEMRAFFARGDSDEEICERVAEEATAVVTVSPQQAPGNETLTCKLCKRFVQMVDRAIAQDMSQVQQVREVIGDICDSMAVDSMCHTFLKNYDNIVNWLIHGTDPLVVCERISMCVPCAQEQEDDSTALVPASKDLALASNHSCFYCVHAAVVIRKVATTMPALLPVLKTVIKLSCKLTPPCCKCSRLVHNFTEVVDSLKAGETPRAVCHSLHMCKANKTLISIAPAMDVESESFEDAVVGMVAPYAQSNVGFSIDKPCFYCDYVTTILEVFGQEDADQLDQIRGFADAICSMLGPDNKCHVYVDKLDFVLDALKKGEHPRDICVELKYCNATQTFELPQQASESTALSTFDPKIVQAVQEISSVDSCFFCTQLGNLLQVALAQDRSQVDQIRQIADVVCGMMDANNKCHPVMDNIDELIDGLEKGDTPKAACHAMQFCPKALPSPSSLESALVTYNPALVQVVQDMIVFSAETCFFCTQLGSLVQMALAQDRAQIDQIRQIADIICDAMPQDNKCHAILKQIDTMINSIEKGDTPEAACELIELCPASSPTMDDKFTLTTFDPALVKSVQDAFMDPESCFFCTQVASLAEVAIAQDPGQIDQIRQIADIICDVLPQENKCHAIMKQFDEVVDALKKGEDPKAICVHLNYCSSSLALLNPHEKLLHNLDSIKRTEKNGNTCAYCSGVVTVLEFALQEKPDEVQQMREAAGIVCDLLPVDDECHQDLKNFDVAVSLLKSGKAPQEICVTLKYCSTLKSASAVKISQLSFMDSSLAPSKCTMCKQNTLLLASLSTKPNSIATFTKELHSVCRLIPNAPECELLMKHRDVIVESLKNNESVEQICTRIHACGAVAEVEAAEEKSMSMGCLLCEYTAEVLERANKSQKELRMAKVALETMCTILPPNARCDVLSSKFDELVTMVQKGQSASQACHALSLCDAAFVQSPTKMTATPVTREPIALLTDIQ